MYRTKTFCKSVRKSASKVSLRLWALSSLHRFISMHQFFHVFPSLGVGRKLFQAERQVRMGDGVTGSEVEHLIHEEPLVKLLSKMNKGGSFFTVIFGSFFHL